MSKYQSLWDYIKSRRENKIMLSFKDVKNICGFEIDHSFLNAKQELKNFGYEVTKIFLKNKTILFSKISLE